MRISCETLVAVNMCPFLEVYHLLVARVYDVLLVVEATENVYVVLALLAQVVPALLGGHENGL